MDPFVRYLKIWALCVSLGLAACGGGGSSSEPPPPETPPPETPPPETPPPETPPPEAPPPTLTVDDVTVTEDAGVVTFIVRAAGEIDNIMVDYATTDGTAVAGSDYTTTAGTLTFSAGASEQTVSVPIVDDATPEPEESFDLTLSNALNAEISDATAVATVTDDDLPAICGEPSLDTGAASHLRLWKDCTENVWRLRVVGADSQRYDGSIGATAPLSNLTPVALDAGDSATAASANSIDFSVLANQPAKGFDFVAGEDTGTCVAIDAPDGATATLGNGNLTVSGSIDLGTLEACAPPPVAEGPYNVFVVFTDDQRFDTLQYMPAVSTRLAPIGVTFENTYVPTPLCCPARASTYAGGFLAQNTGVLENNAPNGGLALFDDTSNMGVQMQGAGYNTQFIGKWLNDYPAYAPYVPPGWHEFVGRSVLPNRDWTTFNYVVGTSADSSTVGTEEDTGGLYHVYYERDQIIDFIEQTPEDQPFFVFWSTTPPHAPATPDDPDATAFDTFLYRERGYDDTDLSDKPEWVRNYDPTIDLVGDEAVRDQLRVMLPVDRSIDAILDAMAAQGRLENTVIIVTSDNGYMWGEHTLWGKNKPYEESLRVPMLVVMPGITPRSEEKLVSAVLDLMPTVYDIVGIDAESDGMSLLPLLEDPNTPWRNELFFEKYSRPPNGNSNWIGLRRDNWKYTEYWTGETELFDLSADPYEEDNRSGDPTVADVEAALAERARELQGPSINPLLPFELDGTVNEAYDLEIKVWGGVLPITWSLESGTLPPGLSLDTATGRITGTPTTAGTWPITVKIVDSGLATQAQRPHEYIYGPFDIVIND